MESGGRSREEGERSGDAAMVTKVGHRGVGIEKIVEEENRGPTTKRCGGDITKIGLNRRIAACSAAQILKDVDGDAVVC